MYTRSRGGEGAYAEPADVAIQSMPETNLAGQLKPVAVCQGNPTPLPRAFIVWGPAFPR